MARKIIVIAPFDNKAAWPKADFICDGLQDDEVGIQAALNLVGEKKFKLRLPEGTYVITDSRILPEEE